jgi:hypothetical protein
MVNGWLTGRLRAVIRASTAWHEVELIGTGATAMARSNDHANSDQA